MPRHTRVRVNFTEGLLQSQSVLFLFLQIMRQLPISASLVSWQISEMEEIWVPAPGRMLLDINHMAATRHGALTEEGHTRARAGSAHSSTLLPIDCTR